MTEDNKEQKGLDPVANMALARKEPINIDFSRGIKPQNYGELMQFSALYAQSGLAPKSFENSASKLAIAISMCMELGRPIITGLADMAVINGKVSVYGDAALALVRASGLLVDFKEWEEGEPYKDGWTFYCTMKRKDTGEERKGVWSWEDSKRAGFDNPQRSGGGPDNFSPWRRFTRRMMTFKARNFIMRDLFADVLKGMRLVEDAQDAIDLEPTASGAWGTTAGLSDTDKTENLKNILAGSAVDQVEVKPKKKPLYDPEIAKEYSHKRAGADKGRGGMKLYVMENMERIRAFPIQNFLEVKEKFIGFYGLDEWPAALKHPQDKAPVSPAPKPSIEPEDPPEVEAGIEQESDEPPWEGTDELAEETGSEDAGEPEEPPIPEICIGCIAEKCNGAYNLTFKDYQNVLKCMHFNNGEKKPEPVKDNGPITENGKTFIVCHRIKGLPRKSVDFCAKCIDSEVCADYQGYLKTK